MNVFGVQNINGSATDDTLTIQGSVGATTVDLGGGNDTLNLSGGAFGVTVLNVESVNGSTGNDPSPSATRQGPQRSPAVWVRTS